MGKKSGPKQPPPPDVKGAAAAEGAEARRTAREATYADRPDQYNPFGSLTYGQESYIDPATGERVTKWTQAQGLSPEMQRLFNQRMGTIGEKQQLSSGMMNRIRQEMGGAPDWAQFGQAQGLEYDPTQMRQRAEEAAYGRETARLDPQFQQQGEQLEIKLRNQGLRPGDQAYEAEMDRFNRAKTDAYEQARRGSVGIGQTEAQQLWQQQMGGTEFANALRDKQIQEYLSKRQFSLGEQQALDPSQDLSEMVGAFSGGG